MTIQRRTTIFLGMLVLASLWAFSAAADMLVLKDAKTFHQYPIMRPDGETLQRWVDSYQKAPRLPNASLAVRDARASLSLLNLLDYTPTERNQGQCGNCWAWAGTGALGINLNSQASVKDRLSVQFISSCNTDKSCCEGGWLSNLADFYSTKGFAIPWSNTNADWQNGDGSCNVPCANISTGSQYAIDSISDQTVTTHGVGQSQAIANIKAALNDNQPVWFGFFMATTSAWQDFYNFWDNGSSTDVFNYDPYSGQSENSGLGGHAVLIVGYDDSASEPYWLALNSWGTGYGNRPEGTFRIKMNMNYDNTFISSGATYYSLYWQTLDVAFSGVSQTCPGSLSPSSESFTADAHTSSITVSADSSCAWNATESLNWVAITSGSSGTGNGTISFTVDENTETSSRSGTLTVGEKTFTVSQLGQGEDCSYSISPTLNNFTASGGTGEVRVSTATGCDWTATSNASWISITSGTSGSKSGTVAYSVAANTDSSSRTGTVTVGGESHSVTQEGAVTGSVLFADHSCAIYSSSVKINATVNNSQNTSASGYQIYVFAVDEDFNCSGDVSGYVLARSQVPEVQGGGTVSISETVSLESQLSGKWYIIMFLVEGSYYVDCSNEGQIDLSTIADDSDDGGGGGGGGCFLLKEGM